MKTIQTPAIILSRTDYGEADRIVRVLTPELGKVSIMARGSRKPRSKLAGAIELFSVSELTLAEGRSEIKTLISARLTKHYKNIVQDIDRVQCGYELVKILNRVTEEMPEPGYFELMTEILEALDDLSIDLQLIKLWFAAKLLQLSGHAPNLSTDSKGQNLALGDAFNFDYDNTCFNVSSDGLYSANDIKFVRLLFSNNRLQSLTNITNLHDVSVKNSKLVYNLCQMYLGFGEKL